MGGLGRASRSGIFRGTTKNAPRVRGTRKLGMSVALEERCLIDAGCVATWMALGVWGTRHSHHRRLGERVDQPGKNHDDTSSNCCQ